MSWSLLFTYSCQGTFWQERVVVLILSTAWISRINSCFNLSTTLLLKNSLHFMINYFPYRKNPDGHFQCEFRLTRWKSSQVSIFQKSFLHTWSGDPLFYIKYITPRSLSISLKDVFLTFIDFLRSLLNFKLLQTGKHQTRTCPDLLVPMGRLSMSIKMPCLTGFLPFLYILLPITYYYLYLLQMVIAEDPVFLSQSLG